MAASRAWRMFYAVFAGLFVFSLVVAVSPNLFDNIKLMHYWHALNSVFVAAWLVKVASGNWPRKLIASLLMLVSIASGLLAIQAENQAGDLVFTNEDLSAAEYVRATHRHMRFF